MTCEWLLHPVWYYGLVATGMCFCLYLSASVLFALRAQQARINGQKRDIESLAKQLEEGLRELKTELRESERMPGVVTQTRSAVNLSTRSQALRLHRRGESPQQIAATLQVPVGEVKLLLKVHQVLVEQF